MSTRTVRITAAAAIVRWMKAQRVVHDAAAQPLFAGVMGIFGHGNVAGLGQALEEHGEGLRFIQPKNEQAMVHAAIAYAKAKRRGQVWACTTSVGPGATNMITGAATATVNRLPVLLLPGDIFANRLPAPVLQQLESPSSMDVSVNDCFKPVSRFWDRINRPEQLLASLPEAARVLVDPAETGAVTICLPEDVQAESFDCPVRFFEPRTWLVERRPPAGERIAEAARILRAAKRPLVVAGGGVRYADAHAALARFADATGVPVCGTQAGMGALVDAHPAWLGSVGVTGTAAANAIARDADVVLVVGTRLSDFTTASKTQFQHDDVRFVSINVNAFDAHKHGALPIVADARAALDALTSALDGWRADAAHVAAATAQKTSWAQERAEMDRARGAAPTQADVIRAMNQVVGTTGTVVHAAGGIPGDIHKLWASQTTEDYHSEYGFSCMGYEIAGALGVKLAQPEREVYAFLGDGSYLMLHSELLTSVQEGAAIIVVVLDNRGYQCIHNLQRGCGGNSFGNEFTNAVDFKRNAESYGCIGVVAETIEGLQAQLALAKASSRTTVISVPLQTASKLPGTSWWDVPMAEQSGVPGVVEARRAYETAKQQQRFYYRGDE